jgi:hypothetical protein
VKLGDDVTLGKGVTLNTTPTYIKGSRHPIYQADATGLLINSGRISRPLDWWDRCFEKAASENGYTADQVKEYRAYIECFKSLASLKRATGQRSIELNNGDA